MNKFQKLAVRMAKDDEKKSYWSGTHTRELVNGYISLMKKTKTPYRKALAIKNLNKKLFI